MPLSIQGLGLASSIASYWKFDENSGTSLTDATGNANTGTFQGTTGSQWVTGLINSGLSFDGTDNYISTTTSISNPLNYTLAAWFKTSTASGAKIIGFENNQTGTGSGQTDRNIYVGTDGKLYYVIYNGGNVSINSSGTVTDGNWHLAVATQSGTAMTLYLDGASQGSNTGTPQSYSGYWRIGSYRNSAYSHGANGYFSGTIDEVGIWNRALSSSEITTLYNSGSGRQYPFTGVGAQTGNLENFVSNTGSILADVDASGDISTTGTLTATGAITGSRP